MKASESAHIDQRSVPYAYNIMDPFYNSLKLKFDVIWVLLMLYQPKAAGEDQFQKVD